MTEQYEKEVGSTAFECCDDLDPDYSPLWFNVNISAWPSQWACPATLHSQNKEGEDAWEG